MSAEKALFIIDEVLKPAISKLETNQSEILRELGKLEGMQLASELKDAVRDLRKVDNEHTASIGRLSGAIEQMGKALGKADDKGLADAAKGLNLTINSGTSIGSTGDVGSIEEHNN